jgi:PAS domain S-box-containing protein
MSNKLPNLEPFFNNALDIMLVSTIEGKYIHINPAWERLTGFTIAESTGRSFTDFIHPEDLQSTFKVMEEQIASGQLLLNYENRYLCKDHSYIWLSWNSMILHEEGLVYAFAHDITKQKNIEQELLNLNARLAERILQRTASLVERLEIQSLRLEITNILITNEKLNKNLQLCTETFIKFFDASLVRIWLFNPENNLLKLNASSGIYTHLDGEDSEILLGQYTVGKIAEIRQSIVSNSPLDDSLIHDQESIKQEGLIAFAGYPMLLGEKLLGVIAMFDRHPFGEIVIEEMQQIANLIALGIDRQQKQQELQKLAAIIENSPDFIATSDLNNRMTYINPAGCEMVGISPVDVTKTHLNDYHPVRDQKIIKNIVIPDIKNNGYWKGEMKLQHFITHQTIDVDSICFVLKDIENGEDIGLATIQRDITTRKKRDLYLTTLVQIQRQLLVDRIQDSVYDYILSIIGVIFHLDRVILWKISHYEQEKIFELEHQWWGKNITPLTHDFAQINECNEYLNWIEKNILNQEFFQSLTDDLPEKIKDFLHQEQVKSTIAFPLIIQGRIWGIVTCNHCVESKIWHLTEAIFLMAAVNAIAIGKQRQINQAQLQRQLTAIENATDGIAITNHQGNFLYVNPAFSQMFGYNSPQELLGRNWRIFHDQSEVFLIEKNIAMEIKKYGKYQGKSQSKRADNSTFIKEYTLTIINDQEVLCIARDITAKNQAEQALKQSEERYRNIVETTQEGIWIIDPDCKITYINPQITKIFGYTETEMLGHYVCNFIDQTIHEQSPEYFCSYWQKIDENKDICFIRKDGSKLWAMLSNTPMFDHNQKFQGVLVMITDITERYQTQAKLKAQYKGFPIPTYNWQKQGKNFVLIDYNRAAEEITYGHIHKFLGANLNEFYANDPEIRADFIQCYEEQKTLNKEMWYRFRSNNELKYLAVTYVFLSPDTIMVHTHDLTAKKQAEEELRKALKTEKILNDLKTQLIDVSSHEFRTPLTVISGSTEFLLKRYYKLTDEKKIQYLYNIQEANKRLKSLIDDILTISRAESGKMTLQLVPVNLNYFFDHLIEEWQIGITQKHDITFIAENLPDKEMYCDEKLLHHIVNNLVSNAAKYSPENSEISVIVHYQSSDNQLVLQIKDQGIGIPDHDQPHIFESFHRASNTGKIPGTGLGLNIVKKYVELHGGTITFTSKIGVGTTFTVTIPIENR